MGPESEGGVARVALPATVRVEDWVPPGDLGARRCIPQFIHANDKGYEATVNNVSRIKHVGEIQIETGEHTYG